MSEISSPAGGRLSPLASAAFSGIRASILLGGSDAPMTVIEMRIEEDHGAPTHISAGEDKLFAVTAGRLRFLIGAEFLDARPGDYMFVPKGTPHSFRAEAGAARMTLVASPSGHDAFFQAMSALRAPHAPADVAAVCERFGQQMVGPVVR